MDFPGGHVTPWNKDAMVRQTAHGCAPRRTQTIRAPYAPQPTRPPTRPTPQQQPRASTAAPESSIDDLFLDHTPRTAAPPAMPTAPQTTLPEREKPLLYLDIDGVLNPVCPHPDAGFTVHRLHGSTVLISPRHGSWLRELSTRYQLVWASTWGVHANLCIAPLLHLPALPWVAVGRHPGGDWPSLVRHAAGRPFAWLDVLIPEAVLHSSAARVDRLLLPVDPGQGLRRSHVDRLLRRPPLPLTLPRRG